MPSHITIWELIWPLVDHVWKIHEVMEKENVMNCTNGTLSSCLPATKRGSKWRPLLSPLRKVDETN